MILELTDHQAKQLIAMIEGSSSEPFVVLTQQIQAYFTPPVVEEVVEEPVLEIIKKKAAK
jgi:hypothetical protein